MSKSKKLLLITSSLFLCAVICMLVAVGAGTSAFDMGADSAPSAINADNVATVAEVDACTQAHIDTFGSADGHTGTKYTGTFEDGGKYYLNEDKSYLTIGAGKTVTLCLNGHSISGKGGYANIKVEEGATLILHDCKNEGVITNTSEGKAVARGVTVNGGTFIMYGGKIINNFINTDPNGTEEGNDGKNGGGVSITNSGTFTMFGGEISGNCDGYVYNGGGVHVNNSTFTMNGGTISGNTSTSGGGVSVTNNGIFTMNGGKIKNNHSGQGGGVYVNQKGTFTMNGGEITDNVAAGYYDGTGGGVEVFGGTFNLSGGKIIGNISGRYENNELVDDCVDNVHLSNNPIVTSVITVTKKLAEGTEIGIAHYGDTADVIAVDYAKYNKDDEGNVIDPRTYFIPNSANKILTINNNDNKDELIISFCVQLVVVTTKSVATTTYHGTLEEALEKANETSTGVKSRTITLLADMEVENGSVKVATDKVGLTLDLNGKIIKGGLNNTSGSVINVKAGAFTLDDSDPTAEHRYDIVDKHYVFAEDGAYTLTGGVIIGGSTSSGGGVYVTSATFTMYGGTICDNSATSISSSNDGGGGVRVVAEGAFIMYGGSISNNSANKNGGGVYVNNSTFEMYGGEISGNNGGMGKGGGIYLTGAKSVVTLYRSENGTYGTIRDNKSRYGGGVYIDNGTFTMDAGTISKNTADGSGGAVYVNNSTGAFIMNDGTIGGNSDEDGNMAMMYGGSAVYVNEGSFTMNNGTLNNNTTKEGNGGAVHVKNGTFIMKDGTISNSYIVDELVEENCGGGVYVDGGEFTMYNGEISGNGGVLTANGGGVYVTLGTFTMHDGTIKDNNVKTSGGGVYVNSGEFTMHNGEISGNGTHDVSNGGGVYVKNSTFTMHDGTISGNLSSIGGGVYVGSSAFTMYNGEISENGDYRTSSGGGVYVWSGTFTMHDGTISGNEAFDGGGVYVNGSGSSFDTSSTFTMKDGTIRDNKVRIAGGGVYIGVGKFTMENGTISDNLAVNYGGGVYLNGSDLSNKKGEFTMENGTISGNSSLHGGGVYINEAGPFTMKNGTIKDNYAEYQKPDFEEENVKVSPIIAGGGVVLIKATLNLYNGTIYDNYVGYFDESIEGQEEPEIIRTANSNLILRDQSVVNINEELDATKTKIGVAYYPLNDEEHELWEIDPLGAEGYVITRNYPTYNRIESIIEEGIFFFADDPSQYINIVPIGNDNASEVVLSSECEHYRYLISYEAETPSCTEDYIKFAYKHCSRCGKYYDGETGNEISEDEFNTYYLIKATGHKKVLDTEHALYVEATCTEHGNNTYKCEVCGLYLGSESVDPIPHTLTHTPANDATCTETGNIEYWYCSMCETYYTDEECTKSTTLENTVIPVIAHPYGEPSWDWASDYSSATATFICGVCGHTETAHDDEIDKLSQAVDGEIVTTYTATVTFNSNQYSDIKETRAYGEGGEFNIQFKDKTVTYTGNPYSLLITGTLPAGVTYAYEGNGQVEVGTHTVTVHFYHNNPGYEPIDDMTAELTIEQAEYDMSGVSFPDATVAYTGNAHSLSIRGTLPAGVTYTYENNSRVNTGSQIVTVKFTGDAKNYKPIPDMKATLKVTPASFGLKDLSLESTTVSFDGNTHQLVVNGNIPEGVDVEYYVVIDDQEVKFDGAMDAGTYEVRAKFVIRENSENYKTIHPLSAKLTIVSNNVDPTPEIVEPTVDSVEAPVIDSSNFDQGAKAVYADSSRDGKSVSWIIAICAIVAEVILMASIGAYIAFGSFQKKKNKSKK